MHDELIIEAPLKEKDIAARILTEEMENAFQMNAPLVAEAKSGHELVRREITTDKHLEGK